MAASLTCLKTGIAHRPLRQIKRDRAGGFRFAFIQWRPRSMFDSDRMSDELRALKVDVTRLLSAAGEEMFESSKDRAEALADQIKAALAELGETVSEEQEQLQGLIADRPITSLASAFALGVVVGFMLRRH
jgi:ElaB/YqjD/DUF883 family membrane-anchored ribosome-binding protein